MQHLEKGHQVIRSLPPCLDLERPVFGFLKPESTSSTFESFFVPFPDPGGADVTQDALCDPCPEEIISRRLSEQSRFAYAALCGISLGQLFAGPENRWDGQRQKYHVDVLSVSTSEPGRCSLWWRALFIPSIASGTFIITKTNKKKRLFLLFPSGNSSVEW